MPTSPVVLGTVALVLTYSAYVAEVFRAGIESVHPQPAARGPLARARPTGRRCGSSCCRRRCARSTPPLLNDFVALQKDVGLISVLGAVDAVRAAQIEIGADASTSRPYVVAGLLFVLLAMPVDPAHRRGARARAAPAPSRRGACV